MNLIVDIGNTLVKLAVFDGGRIVAQRCVERLHPSMLGELLEGRRAAKAVVASTRGEADDVIETVRPYADYLLEFTSQTPVPVANAYHTPETLGRDRLAAAVGATVLYPGRNVLIVDFGTAVTIDLVTADNTFRGGCISPGMKTRFRALHDYTACLPLCGRDRKRGVAGAHHRRGHPPGGDELARPSKSRAIWPGCGKKIDDLCVIFTGGDAKYFAKRIKNTIFANCNLVFCGLDRILEYNASEEHLD